MKLEEVINQLALATKNSSDNLQSEIKRIVQVVESQAMRMMQDGLEIFLSSYWKEKKSKSRLSKNLKISISFIL